ncbi:hypothetical protein [uncultured Sphingomonas sp.]|uniref:hypothetical protein n=1 Tax=uncultured Sphingomonas sp. TaxID=158754 RepID=UPI0035CB6B5C
MNHLLRVMLSFCAAAASTSAFGMQVNLDPAGGMASLRTSFPSAVPALDKLKTYGQCVVAGDCKGSLRFVLASRVESTDKEAQRRFEEISWLCQRRTFVSDRWLEIKDIKLSSIADALRDAKP